MNRLAAVLKLTRIEHSAMLVIAVVAAELIVSGSLPALPILALSLLSPIFISMAAFAINDYFDVEADRANRRIERPIVSGAISKSGALWISVVCVLIGVAAALFINLDAFLIAVVFGGLAFLYSYRLKDVVMAGNAYIAFAMAIPFIFGNYVVLGTINPNIAVMSLVVFTAGFAREIHGMIRDRKGDAQRKTRNLLYYMSDRNAALIAAVLYAESVLLGIFLFFFRYPFLNNAVYIAPVIIADAVALCVAFGFLFRKDRKFYDLARNLSLGAMALASIAYLACAIWIIPV
jgi:4-hydroxybenzoate polyprenyltransferase